MTRPLAAAAALLAIAAPAEADGWRADGSVLLSGETTTTAARVELPGAAFVAPGLTISCDPDTRYSARVHGRALIMTLPEGAHEVLLAVGDEVQSFAASGGQGSLRLDEPERFLSALRAAEDAPVRLQVPDGLSGVPVAYDVPMDGADILDDLAATCERHR